MGDAVVVEADVFTDGHDAVVAELLFRKENETEWHVAPMQFLGNDHWTGSFRVEELGRYEYTVRGWTDAFLTWQRDLKKREEAGQDLSVDFLIGGALSCNPVLKDAARPAKERYATAMALKPSPPDPKAMWMKLLRPRNLCRLCASFTRDRSGPRAVCSRYLLSGSAPRPAGFSPPDA